MAALKLVSHQTWGEETVVAEARIFALAGTWLLCVENVGLQTAILCRWRDAMDADAGG